MKTEKNILIAFLLNLLFSIIELIGGSITGSIAILSDAIHDLGDALAIGMSYLLEKKSKKKPDEKYTYGYARYSILAAVITTVILLVGSSIVIYNAIVRLSNPVEINYDGMMIFAILGVIINFGAAWITHSGDSLNQRAVNLHMLEDVLGWIVVLVGSIIMKFTGLNWIDSIISIIVSIYIFYNASINLSKALDLFLEKSPKDISISEVKKHLEKIDGIDEIHHVHIWSLDGYRNYATLHAVTKSPSKLLKKMIREEMSEHGINHVTIEFEELGETCNDKTCKIDEYELHVSTHSHHHHHH